VPHLLELRDANSEIVYGTLFYLSPESKKISARLFRRVPETGAIFLMNKQIKQHE